MVEVHFTAEEKSKERVSSAKRNTAVDSIRKQNIGLWLWRPPGSGEDVQRQLIINYPPEICQVWPSAQTGG